MAKTKGGTKTKKPTKATKTKKPATKSKPKTKAVVKSKPFQPEPAPTPAKTSPVKQPELLDDFDHEPIWETVEKVHFHSTAHVLHALSEAFMPNEGDEPNERFFAAWHAFLAIAGWNEDAFWMSYESDDPCPICGDDMGDEGEELPAPKSDTNKLLN